MTNMLKKMTKASLLLLTLIFGIGIFTRFYAISTIPPFIPHDELGYFINAKALQLSGTDITGTWNPFSLVPVTPTLAELTTHLIVLFNWLPINQIVAAKLPFLFMSLLLPFLIAGISYEFTKSKQVSVFAWVITLFNPWVWQIGRMPFDGYASFFFYTFGAYVLLKLKDWQKLWSIPILFVGFYQYQGHKLVFLFWVFAFFLYSIKSHLVISRNSIKTIKNFPVKRIIPQVIVLLFSFLLFTFYLFVQLPNHKSKDRLNTLFTPSSSEIAQLVNEQRRLSLDSPLNKVFINKYSIWTGKIFERFTETYGFHFLFLEGQVSNSAWSVWNHGIFYSIDAALIIFGFIYLIISKRQRLLLFLLSLLAILVVPSLISSDRSYFFRSSLNIPILIFIASLGAEFIRKYFPKIIQLFFVLIYAISIFHFAYLYFVRYPIIASDRQFFSDRVLAEYLRRVPETQKVVFFSPEPEFTVSTYLFFNNILNKDTISEIQNAYKLQNYQIGAKKFIGDCLPIEIVNSDEVVISRHDIRRCEPNEDTTLNSEPVTDIQTFYNSLQIQAIKDSGTYYHIYNDQLCSGLEINPYLRIVSPNQFDLGAMSDKEFCQAWISKLIEN